MGRHLLNGLAMVSLAGAMLFSARAGEVTNAPAHAAAGSASATNSNDVWKLMEDYFAAVAKNQLPKASELGQTVIVKGTNDWNALRFFSWRIFADRAIKHRDRILALTAAQRAAQLTGEKEPAVLDTYARALFENGRAEEAIRHQKRAVELCPTEGPRIEMEANLNRYLRLTRQTGR
jgi:Flp pilus assembly protein TadD